MISPVTQETFNKMEEIYALRGPFTKNKELFPDLLHSLAETYRDTGVEYAELSYSSFIGDREYMEMINEHVSEIEAQTGVKLRFVAGLWRHSRGRRRVITPQKPANPHSLPDDNAHRDPLRRVFFL